MLRGSGPVGIADRLDRSHGVTGLPWRRSVGSVGAGPPRGPGGGRHLADPPPSPMTGPGALGRGEQHRGAPSRRARPCRGPVRRPVRLRPGRRGAATVTVIGSADGAPALAPSAPRRGPSPASGPGAGCRRGGRAGPLSVWPTSASAHSSVPPGVFVGARRGRDSGRPRRGATWSVDGRGSTTRRVHHCRAKGAAEAMSRVTVSCTPRRRAAG